MQSDTQNQSVDVLLPVYNGAATIEESVASLLDQTHRNLRILVIDDGSTDETPDILARLAARDSRVVPIRKPNGGIVEALNFGLEQTSAEFVARQDADDISFPDRIERQLAEMARNPDVVALSGACIHIDQYGEETGGRYHPHDPGLADYTSYPSTEPYLLHPFLMVRREAYVGVGGYRHVIHSEDTDLFWRLRERGRLMNVEEAYGKMRLHTGSISNASIVNGRIMSVTSQLAAISARRRDEGRPDLDFSAADRKRYTDARTLEGILEVAGRELRSDEQRYLRSASAVDLLDKALSRQYELEEEDCRFIRDTYQTIPVERFRGRSRVSWAYRTTILRYLRAGRLNQLSAIFDPKLAGRSVLFRLVSA